MRVITCRDTWSLRDNTNDAGQIHVYLIDLAHLPTSEQHYWKAFNEVPKAGMSEHVIQRDFISFRWLTHPLEENSFLCQILKGSI